MEEKKYGRPRQLQPSKQVYETRKAIFEKEMEESGAKKLNLGGLTVWETEPAVVDIGSLPDTKENKIYSPPIVEKLVNSIKNLKDKIEAWKMRRHFDKNRILKKGEGERVLKEAKELLAGLEERRKEKEDGTN